MPGRTEVPTKSFRSKKLVQSRLRLGSDQNPIVKCDKCEMSYIRTSLDDVASHSNYHNMVLKGRKWSSRWGYRFRLEDIEQDQEVLNRALTPPMSSPMKGVNKQQDIIVKIRKGHTAEVNAMLEIMAVVNKELNASDENEFWSNDGMGGCAFVYVRSERAIGAITIEVLKPGRCKWMVYENKSIVEHVRPVFKLGISRIWVSKSFRGEGVASKLIDIARQNTILGLTIPKHLVAWSQPTESGGKLARKYNGVKHKSGNTLIPCYL